MIVNKSFDLTQFNAYHINALYSKAFFPDNEKEIFQIFRDYPGERIVLLGNGNNIILSKEYYEEPFVIFNGCFDGVEVKGNELVAQAGCTMLQLSELAFKLSLSGFEIFYDIPSSVGGAVVMNAGTKEGEIKDIITKVRYLDLTNMNFIEIEKDVIDFRYRNSYFQNHKDKIVTKVWFNLNKGNPVEIYKRMQDTKSRRWKKQPRDYPNCGSVFKRPPGRFVGPMIEDLGLKGYSIGGAKVSEKHAGFIINYNNATGKDILKLIELIQKKVFDKFKITLEIEQRVV